MQNQKIDSFRKSIFSKQRKSKSFENFKNLEIEGCNDFKFVNGNNSVSIKMAESIILAKDKDYNFYKCGDKLSSIDNSLYSGNIKIDSRFALKLDKNVKKIYNEAINLKIESKKNFEIFIKKIKPIKEKVNGLICLGIVNFCALGGFFIYERSLKK